MNEAYSQILRVNEYYTLSGMELQVLEQGSKYIGGIMDEHTGIPRPNHGSSASTLATYAASIVNPASSYYHHIELLERLKLLAQFMLNRQHEDGTISLGSTNYHSPPDTGFVINGLAQVVKLLEQDGWEMLMPVRDQLLQFMERAMPAMLTGGCHTPNHRWVLASALAQLYDRFGYSALLERAQSWLAEGLDITHDGEWTERSNGIYNAVSDISLYHAAILLERSELLEAVRKNLRMMQYLVYPSGEVITDYSGRQDFGVTSDLSSYYPICALMAVTDHDPYFATMSDLAASCISDPGSVNNHYMLTRLLHPELDLVGMVRKPLPDSYHVVLNQQYPLATNLARASTTGYNSILHSSDHPAFGAPVVRIREGQTSITIMSHTPSFLALRHGQARLLGMKLTTAFTPGIVMFDEFTPTEGGYILRKVMEKGYNGPIPSELLPLTTDYGKETSPWSLLPHQHRPLTHLQRHWLQANVQVEANGWSIRLQSSEEEDLFTQFTLIFGEEGELSGECIEEFQQDQFFWKEGTALYTHGKDQIRISSGAFEHRLTVLRNDIQPSCGKLLVMNLLTPVDITLHLELLSTH